MGHLVLLLLMSGGRRPLGISEKSELEKSRRIPVKPYQHFVLGLLESAGRGECWGHVIKWVRMV